MLRLRHCWFIVRDVVGFSVVNRVWWLVPTVLFLILLAVAVTAGNAALPYAVYTLF